MNDRPNVGIGVLIIKDSQILLGKRKNSHGSGAWAPPGGHLEFGESFEDCAKREVLEETGLEVLSIKRFGFTNDFFAKENKHYVSIFMLVDQFNGIAKTVEPDKFECWQWFNLNELPENLFVSLQNLISQENILKSLNF